MVDQNNISENNLLERYLLGELDITTSEQVEASLHSNAALRNRLAALEEDFEKVARVAAIAPPQELKEQILAKAVGTAAVTSLPYKNKRKSTLFYVISGIAASLLVMLVWSGLKLNRMGSELQQLNHQNNTLVQQNLLLDTEVKDQSVLTALLLSPDTRQYVLEGNALSPTASLVSYVDDNTKTVVVNAAQLPELDADHDYQMWADVEGEMINMGVIQNRNGLLVMNYIDQAESFNLTIEPAGGSDHPTVSRLISNVYL